MKNNSYNKSVYRSLVLIMQFGINMIVPIGMMCVVGIWLDRKMGTSFWTIFFFFIGALAGGQNIYRMAKRIYKTSEREQKKELKEQKKDFKE